MWVSMEDNIFQGNFEDIPATSDTNEQTAAETEKNIPKRGLSIGNDLIQGITNVQ